MQQKDLHHLFEGFERNILGLKRDADSSLIDYIPQFGIKKKVRNLVVSNIFRIFVVVNQIVTNNIKRLPNDYQGQSYRNILYYR